MGECFHALQLPLSSCVDLELHSYRVLSALPAGCSELTPHHPHHHGSQSGPGWQQLFPLDGLVKPSVSHVFNHMFTQRPTFCSPSGWRCPGPQAPPTGVTLGGGRVRKLPLGVSSKSNG